MSMSKEEQEGIALFLGAPDYSPQAGVWTLTAPDGRKWEADTPIRVVAKEQNERIPAHVRLERIMSAVDAQPAEVQEPVAWANKQYGTYFAHHWTVYESPAYQAGELTPLYTHPAPDTVSVPVEPK